MDPILISIVAFVGVAAFVGAIVFTIRDLGSTTAEHRLAVMTGSDPLENESTNLVKAELIGKGLAAVAGKFNGMTQRLTNIQQLFEQANSPVTADTFLLITAGTGVLGAIVAWAAKSPTPLIPVIVLVSGSLPAVWLFLRRRTRFKKFAFLLPDALELVARALRSGHSLNSGLHIVVQEMPAPISTEFGIAYEEQNLGVPIEKALKNMLKRMPNLDLQFFVTAVTIQRQSGGDLAEILEKIGHIIRERFKILGQVKALTGEGRISGIVLMALPIGLFVATYQLNPDYVQLLFTDELGRKMIAGAVIMQFIGAIVIKKIIDIKV
ncbi:MAG: type II secretion system F family protein [Planctomycetaceae bacterium]